MDNNVPIRYIDVVAVSGGVSKSVEDCEREEDIGRDEVRREVDDVDNEERRDENREERRGNDTVCKILQDDARSCDLFKRPDNIPREDDAPRTEVAPPGCDEMVEPLDSGGDTRGGCIMSLCGFYLFGTVSFFFSFVAAVYFLFFLIFWWCCPYPFANVDMVKCVRVSLVWRVYAKFERMWTDVGSLVQLRR